MIQQYPYQNLSLDEMPNEVWRDIVGYEGLYVVSNMGRIKSLARDKKYSRHWEQIIKQQNVNGYLYVRLYKNGTNNFLRVHRIVAASFLSKKEGCEVINHINEIKSDNRAENLEWCTTEYNCNFGTRNEKLSKSQRHHSKFAKPVVMMTLDGEIVKEYSSIRDAGRDGWRRKDISNICRNTGLSKTTKGYIWKFKN